MDKPEMRPISESCGDLMTVAGFCKYVEGGWFIDYDGFGRLATETEESDIDVWPSTFLKLDLPDWATHVVWYNR